MLFKYIPLLAKALLHKYTSFINCPKRLFLLGSSKPTAQSLLYRFNPEDFSSPPISARMLENPKVFVFLSVS
jgi:hypothetical protein